MYGWLSFGSISFVIQQFFFSLVINLFSILNCPIESVAFFRVVKYRFEKLTHRFWLRGHRQNFINDFGKRDIHRTTNSSNNKNWKSDRERIELGKKTLISQMWPNKKPRVRFCLSVCSRVRMCDCHGSKFSNTKKTNARPVNLFSNFCGHNTTTIIIIIISTQDIHFIPDALKLSKRKFEISEYWFDLIWFDWFGEFDIPITLLLGLGVGAERRGNKPPKRLVERI